ncbi:MAG: trypsin-like serine protease [Alphaproteobacteria bacterium]|nr:trypsin-like serine protease [Alphaproteobacteria bacterium]
MNGVVAALLAWAMAAPACAVVITESAWRAAGGAEEAWDQGFSAHEARAAEAPFRAMVALSIDGGREYGVASGVWLGNADGKAFVLTAAHVFDNEAKPQDFRFRSTAGTVRQGQAVTLHPIWAADVDASGAFDFAIVQLDGPLDDAGAPPALYRGRDELGRRAVMVGFGTHGVAPFGHGYRFGPVHGARATAAENIVDRARGGVLTIDLDEPGGPGKNRMGAAAPASDLEGILAPGDSGGALWINFGGEWRIVGVNSSGDPGADYQDVSNFARVSMQISWVREVFPAVRVSGNKGEGIERRQRMRRDKGEPDDQAF